MLMHFLDAAKFGSLEEFQEEYADLGEAKQVSPASGCNAGAPALLLTWPSAD